MSSSHLFLFGRDSEQVPRSPLMPDTLKLAGFFPSRYLPLLVLAVNFRLLLRNFM
jgi:hypothetical protein